MGTAGRVALGGLLAFGLREGQVTSPTGPSLQPTGGHSPLVLAQTLIDRQHPGGNRRNRQIPLGPPLGPNSASISPQIPRTTVPRLFSEATASSSSADKSESRRVSSSRRSIRSRASASCSPIRIRRDSTSIRRFSVSLALIPPPKSRFSATSSLVSMTCNSPLARLNSRSIDRACPEVSECSDSTPRRFPCKRRNSSNSGRVAFLRSRRSISRSTDWRATRS